MPWFEPQSSLFFKKALSGCDQNLLTHTRIHPLRRQPTSSATIFIKRDDENGFLLSGTKKWKYASLIPFLKNRNYQQVVIVGGARSNNAVAAAQVLIENNIEPKFLLKKSHSHGEGGNLLYLRWLVKPEQIRFLEREEWVNIEEVAKRLSEFESNSGKKTFIIPEGAGCDPAVWGTSMMTASILKNEKENSIEFDHIFLDAGTAFTACITTLTLGLLKHKAAIHIIPVAGNSAFVKDKMAEYSEMFSRVTGEKKTIPTCQVHELSSDKSFGSLSQSLTEWMIHFGREQGIITEPVYTAKYFHRSMDVISTMELKGNILLMHSGGLPTLGGFNSEIGKKLINPEGN